MAVGGVEKCCVKYYLLIAILLVWVTKVELQKRKWWKTQKTEGHHLEVMRDHGKFNEYYAVSRGGDESK